MRRIVLIAIGLMIPLVGIATATFNPSLHSGQALQPSTSPVIASGFIEADEIVISSEVSGRVMALYARVGDSVAAGQGLAQLDTATLDAQIQRAEAEVQGAEAALAEVLASPRPEEVEVAAAAVATAEEGVRLAEKAADLARGNVGAAEAVLKAAQADLEKLQAGARAHDLALAEARFDAARRRLQAAWSVRDSIGGAEQRGDLPPGSLDAARAAVAQTETEIRIAQSQLEELRAGARAEDLRASQAAVTAARAGVDAMQAQVGSAQHQLDAARARLHEAEAQLTLVKSGANQEQATMARAKVNAARAALQALQVQRNKMTLLAPTSGFVLEQPIHLGEMTLPGSVLFRLADLYRVKLKVFVPVADIGLIRIGQVAQVSVDSFPGRIFEGRVIHIASEAEFTPRNVQTGAKQTTQVVRVKIEMANPDHALKPGMPADAILVERPNVPTLNVQRSTFNVQRWSGTIQAEQDVVISAEVGGRVVAVNAEEGDEVEAGAVLVHLDEALLEAQIGQARAGIEVAEANLANVKAGARPSRLQTAEAAVAGAQARVKAAQTAVEAARANLRSAQATHQLAQARLDRLAAGASAGELEIARLQVELARAQLWGAQAQRDAKRNGVDVPLSVSLGFEDSTIGPFVLANPVAPRHFDVKMAEVQVTQAESSVRSVELQFDKLAAGPRAEDLTGLQAQVERSQAAERIAQVQLEQAQQAVRVAETQVRQAEAQLALTQSGASPESVAMAEALVSQARAGLVLLEIQREKLTLRTPIAGMITGRTVHAGEAVIPGARLFTISRLDPAILTIYIAEDEIGQVRVAQAVEVQVEALPEQTFTGQVASVASRAEFTPRNLQTKAERVTTVFAVQLRLANPHRLLKPGMAAGVVIQ